jgi:hypothetical protein
METKIVLDENPVEDIVETLNRLLVSLDEIGADIAAAYVDSAIHAIRRQFDLEPKSSDPE